MLLDLRVAGGAEEPEVVLELLAVRRVSTRVVWLTPARVSARTDFLDILARALSSRDLLSPLLSRADALVLVLDSVRDGSICDWTRGLGDGRDGGDDGGLGG